MLVTGHSCWLHGPYLAKMTKLTLACMKCLADIIKKPLWVDMKVKKKSVGWRIHSSCTSGILNPLCPSASVTSSGSVGHSSASLQSIEKQQALQPTVSNNSQQRRHHSTKWHQNINKELTELSQDLFALLKRHYPLLENSYCQATFMLLRPSYELYIRHSLSSLNIKLECKPCN